ncbi:hypothetical protein GCM10009611_09220 [Arthrobacter roseus]
MRAIKFLAAVCVIAAGISACSSPGLDDSPAEAGSESLQSTSVPPTSSVDAGSTDDMASPSISTSASASPSPSSSALVEPFPTEVLPVMGASTVLSSSVDLTGDMAVVSITASVDKSADEVLEYYRSSLSKAGFKELKDEFSDDSIASQDFFRNGTETINVSVVAGTKNQKESVYTVGGTLLTESMD